MDLIDPDDLDPDQPSVVVLAGGATRYPNDVEVEAAAGHERGRRAEAIRKRNEFVARAKAAEVRLSHLHRELIPEMGFGVAELMLIEVLRGAIVPRDAKQAMDVAKLAIEMARLEKGEAGSIGVGEPMDRTSALEAIDKVTSALQERRNRVAAGEDPDEPETWDAESAVPALGAATVPPMTPDSVEA